MTGLSRYEYKHGLPAGNLSNKHRYSITWRSVNFGGKTPTKPLPKVDGIKEIQNQFIDTCLFRFVFPWCVTAYFKTSQTFLVFSAKK
eukprot:UN11803